MRRLAETDLHLTFRNWTSSNSEMSDTENRRDRRRDNNSSEQDERYFTNNTPYSNRARERILPAEIDESTSDVSNNENHGFWTNYVEDDMENNDNDADFVHEEQMISEDDSIDNLIDPNLTETAEQSITNRRREISALFNVIRQTSERSGWNNRPVMDNQLGFRRFPIGFVNSHFRLREQGFDHSFDIDHYHEDGEAEQYYNFEENFNGSTRLRDFKNRFARSNTVYGNTFFKKHPEHEIERHLHIRVEKFGLTSLLNQLLVERSNKSKQTLDTKKNTPRKRTYNDTCFADNNLDFMLNKDEQVFTKLSKSSFLKNGSIFSSDTKINGVPTCLNFTAVNYDNLSTSGYFQIGSVKLGFSGIIVDFIDNDLRYDSSNFVLLESNAFSNMLRNKLIHSKKFNKLFDMNTKKSYNNENWKPFSLNRMGYIKFNRISSSYCRTFEYPHKIIPFKTTKFPNGSVFHKMKASSDNQLESLKILSRWFDIAPLNQFGNTPAPPTPPNNLHKCSNNPENLLVCDNCINLILSKYIFLKLEIDIEELFEENEGIFSDYIYKHRRRFNYYANKLAKQNNHNLRTHLERTIDQNNYTFSSNQRRDTSPSSSSVLASSHRRSRSASEENYHEPFQSTQEDMIDQVLSSDLEEDEDDIEMRLMFSDNEIAYFDSPINSMTFNDNNTAQEISETSRDSLPVSDERTEEYHPILDPVYNNDGSDDDFDTPYNYVIHSDNRRISRLLFNINMVRQQYTPSREPLSALKMYKGNKKGRMKMILMVSINRKTGELQMTAGNMDPNSWSSEKNDGELFEDVETFGKVFSLFMNDNKKEYSSNTKFTKEAKNWIKRKHLNDADKIKRLLALQLLTNPSIIDGYRNREETKRQKLNKHKQKKQELFKKPKYMNSPDRRLKRKKTSKLDKDLFLDDETHEKLQLYMDESKNLHSDPHKVITMYPGWSKPEKAETEGINLAFSLE